MEGLQLTQSSENPLGSRTFRGKFKDEPIVVKKLPINCGEISQNSEHWEKLIELRDDHLVKYRHSFIEADTRVLVMDICQGSMLDYCQKKLDENVSKCIKAIDIMWQMTCGLEYLHHNNIAHGDLVSKNVLFWKKDLKTRRVLVKLTGYGYHQRSSKDGFKKDFQGLILLFHAVATKKEAEPIDSITQCSIAHLAEIAENQRTHVLELIKLFPNDNLQVTVETLLRHPLFTMALDKARSKLKDTLSDSDVASTWNEEKLNEWKTYFEESGLEFGDESFTDLKDILLSESAKSDRIDDAFETTPKHFSKYIWHLATTTNVQHQKNPRPTITEEVLGKGSFGRVLKGFYTDGNGKTFPVACKQCKNNETEAKEIFNKEIKTLKQLNHLFVTKYIDVIEENSERYIVMELCEGTLKQYVKGELERIPKVTLHDKIFIGQITLGMAYIHDQNIIHKDLKPDNILLWSHPSNPELVLAKIADFGFAKELKPGQIDFSETAHPGTVGYMAPELLSVQEGNPFPASFASDVYSLGVTIGWIAFEGDHPFGSQKMWQNIRMINGQISLKLQKLSWELQHLILKLTDQDPRSRPRMYMVLRHPYFVLTNERTKWQFVDELTQILFPEIENTYDIPKNGLLATPVVFRQISENLRKSFNNGNLQEWYNSLDADSSSLTADEYEDEINKNVKKKIDPIDEQLKLKLESKQDYNRFIKEAMKSEYSSNVESKINQIMFSKVFNICSFSIRLYKLINSSPKLLSLYFWSQMDNVFNKEQTGQQATGRRTSIQKNQVEPVTESQSCMTRQLAINTISDLRWSSLFYDDEELIDVLCRVKYVSEDKINASEFIEIIGKCNITEKILPSLLDRMKDPAVLHKSFSLLVQSSHFKNASKITEAILDRTRWQEGLPVHQVVLNRGKYGADILKILLKKKTNLNIVDSQGSTPLHNAVSNESYSALEMVKLLLRCGTNPIVRNHLGFMPFDYAAMNEGNDAHSITKELLDFRDNYNAKTAVKLMESTHLAVKNTGKFAPEFVSPGNVMMPVHFAALNSRDYGPIIMKKLLENGADPNAVDDYKRTPLHFAAQVKENVHITEIMSILLEHGGDPNAINTDGQTPVHYAAGNEGQHAHLIMDLLLSKSGNPTVKDKNGLTPFHNGVINTGTRGVEIRKILASNRNIINDHVNEDQDTFLHCIARHANSSIGIEHAQLVLDNGGDANLTNKFGFSPVHLATLNISSVGPSLLKLLLEKGGNPNLPENKLGRTPVHFVALNKGDHSPEMMRLLRDNGGSFSAQDKEKVTPLHLAARFSGIKGPELVRIIVEHGEDPNVCDIYQYTPLHLALRNEDDGIRFEIVNELLKEGVNLNAKDTNEETPVHYVVTENRNNSLEIIKLLVENQTNDGNVSRHNDNVPKARQANVKDNNGRTPLHLAVRNEMHYSVEMMTILLKNGEDPNVTDIYGETPFHYATSNEGEQAPEKSKLLLDNGGDLTLKNVDELTPIHCSLLNMGSFGFQIRKILSINEENTNAPVNENGDTLLHCIIVNIPDNTNKIEHAKILFQNGANPNITNKVGRSPVHLAVLQDSGFNLLKLLLDNGGNPNLPDKLNGSSPVHYATSNKGEEAPKKLQLLLDNNGDLTLKNNNGLSPIHLSVLNTGPYGPEMRKILHINKEITNASVNENGDTLLHCVVANILDDNNIEHSQILFQNGANPNVLNKFGRSPVHLAVLRDSGFDLLKLLLDNGGNPNLPDKIIGATPVHYAASNKGEQASKKLQLLLDNNGDITMKNKKGLTPIHLSLLNMGPNGSDIRKIMHINEKITNAPVNENGNTLLHCLIHSIIDNHERLEHAQILLENGANPNVLDESGLSPAHMVARVNSPFGPSLLKLLLEKGGNPNLPHKENGATPVHYAASSNAEIAPEIIKILIEKKANPNAIDKFVRTPIRVALENKNDDLRLKIVTELLKGGGNPNAKDANGQTPVHYVVTENRKNSLEMIKLLVENGGDVNVPRHDKKTPLDLVFQTGRKKCCSDQVKRYVQKQSLKKK